MMRIPDPLGLYLAIVILNAPCCFGQDATDRQVQAGGRMSFDVASVKPSKIPAVIVNGAPPRLPTFSLGPDDAKPPGGRFYARFPLGAFLGFAYKLAPFQTADALANAPKWVRTDLFEIEAEAQGNPTKDQMRLMMQSLLAERFKLAVHFENKERPVLALTPVKAGKLGPKLRPHSQGPPCPEDKALDLSVVPDPRKEVFPHACAAGVLRGMPDGTFFVGSRNSTMAITAQTLYSYGSMAGEIDRPVVDQTDLKGTFDFVLEYKPDNNNGLPRTLRQATGAGDLVAGDKIAGVTEPDVAPGAPAASGDFGGTPFVEALRDQLGLKLVRTNAPVPTLVIDHVEMPSEN